jgi:two-component system sensor histidine kinase BaeS
LSVRTVVDSGDELGQLGQDFNLLAHTLERNEQARRAFMADISHELRTPLAVLRGELEALGDGVRAVTPAALASLREEVRALGKLIDDLYDLARSDIGALEYRRADVDVAGLLGRAVDAYRERFDARRIAIECGIAPGPVVLRADPDRLQQLFANLLENTLRYTDPGGELRVLCAPRDGWLRIDLQDSAPGVPAESLDRLFERLYRVERSRGRAHGGAGLGLAICRNIVDAHGGRIAAKASPLGGLWIEILLPLPERGEPRDTPAV